MFALNKTGLNLAKQLGTFQCRQGGSISVILLDQLEKKGKKGEIIKVKRGFARNFLVPRKLAAYATDANKIKYAQLFEVVPDVSRESLLNFKDEVLKFERSSTIGGALFGSVSVADVKAFFDERAIEVEKIELVNGSLKELGLHTVNVDGINFQINIVEPPSNLKNQV